MYIRLKYSTILKVNGKSKSSYLIAIIIGDMPLERNDGSAKDNT